MLDWDNPEIYKLAYKKGILVPKDIALKNIYNRFNTRFKKTNPNPNLDNPTKLSEKIQWLKFNYKDPIQIHLQDKLLYKKYLKHIGLEEYATELLCTWKNLNEVDFDSLLKEPFIPFVLKPNNMSGGKQVFIFTENTKKNIQYDEIKTVLRDFNYGLPYIDGIKLGEWVYMKMKPFLFAEKYYDPDTLEFSDGTNRPVEYRIFCFNQKVKHIQVNTLPNSNDVTLRCMKHFNGRAVLSYNADWEKAKIGEIEIGKITKAKEKFVIDDCARPTHLEEMIEVSEKISKPVPFLRVDWIAHNGKLKTFENSLFPSSGFLSWEPNPQEIDLMFGEMLDLKK